MYGYTVPDLAIYGNCHYWKYLMLQKLNDWNWIYVRLEIINMKIN